MVAKKVALLVVTMVGEMVVSMDVMKVVSKAD